MAPVAKGRSDPLVASMSANGATWRSPPRPTHLVRTRGANAQGAGVVPRRGSHHTLLKGFASCARPRSLPPPSETTGNGTGVPPAILILRLELVDTSNA